MFIVYIKYVNLSILQLRQMLHSEPNNWKESRKNGKGIIFYKIVIIVQAFSIYKDSIFECYMQSTYEKPVR